LTNSKICVIIPLLSVEKTRQQGTAMNCCLLNRFKKTIILGIGPDGKPSASGFEDDAGYGGKE